MVAYPWQWTPPPLWLLPIFCRAWHPGWQIMLVDFVGIFLELLSCPSSWKLLSRPSSWCCCLVLPVGTVVSSFQLELLSRPSSWPVHWYYAKSKILSPCFSDGWYKAPVWPLRSCTRWSRNSPMPPRDRTRYFGYSCGELYFARLRRRRHRF